VATLAFWLLIGSASGQATGGISGRVFDATTDQGADGVIVSGPAGSSTVTDSGGYFQFANVSPGSYVLSCKGLQGFTAESGDLRKKIEVRSGTELHVEFPVSRPVAIRGIVQDAQGRPVSGAAIRGRWSAPDIVAVSGGDGRFTLEGFAPWSKLTLDAQARGLIYDPLERFEIPEGGLDDFVVQLRPAAGINGKLVDAKGNRIPDTYIKLRRRTPHGNRGTATKTDALGRFSVQDFAAGDYEFSISTEAGQKTKLLRHTFTDGEILKDVTLVYDPDLGLKISGRIIDSEGNGLEGVGFAVMAKETQTHVKSGADGYFTANGLDEGEHRLTYFNYLGDMYMGGSRSAMAGEEGIEILLSLRPPRVSSGPVRGRVLDAETDLPIPNFRYVLKRGVYRDVDPDADVNYSYVDFYGSIGNSSWRPVHDSTGAFDMRTYDTGDHTLAIRADGYANFLGAVVAPDDDLVVRLYPEKRIEGTIRDPFGKPVAGAQVFLGAADWSPNLGPHRGHEARSDRDGSFSLGGASGTEIQVAAWHDDWGTATGIVSSGGSPVSRIDFAFPATGSLAGYVVLDGEAIRDVSIWVWRVDTEELMAACTGRVCMDDSNRFLMRHFPPGKYRFRVENDSYNWDKKPKRESEQIVTIQPHAETKIEIHLYLPE
jgi:protocatechuate 3,4-dioxygenase beta subunit